MLQQFAVEHLNVLTDQVFPLMLQQSAVEHVIITYPSLALSGGRVGQHIRLLLAFCPAQPALRFEALSFFLEPIPEPL